ncbi:MAG: hypothetical protein H7095_03680 [Pseudopedobacter sp.]|nr:hypothetical protein [Deinococcales bacterium]
MASNGISAQVRRSQSLRRQMTADIAHDLKPSSRRLQTLHFEALHFEVRQLERRVSDLRTLSLAATSRNFRALLPGRRSPLERSRRRKQGSGPRQFTRIGGCTAGNPGGRECRSRPEKCVLGGVSARG